MADCMLLSVGVHCWVPKVPNWLYFHSSTTRTLKTWKSHIARNFYMIGCQSYFWRIAPLWVLIPVFTASFYLVWLLRYEFLKISINFTDIIIRYVMVQSVCSCPYLPILLRVCPQLPMGSRPQLPSLAASAVSAASAGLAAHFGCFGCFGCPWLTGWLTTDWLHDWLWLAWLTVWLTDWWWLTNCMTNWLILYYWSD